MKKVIERIVESPGAPNENDLWLNGKTLKRFQNGEWVAISGGNSGGGGGSDSESDIQIVELTYDHLPATGTLSASNLAKLDSDNCLLVMNGKYFRKTFSSDGGIDYKEIGLTTVLGGVRSIYFTASKPDGEYTIAYTYPVEANTQTQATTALEKIKVGNTTYSVPLSPMIVEGTVVDGNGFVPGPGEPTFAEAMDHMFRGGLVYMLILDDGEPLAIALAEFADSESILSPADGNPLAWRAPIIINGTFESVEQGTVFIPDSGELPWSNTKNAYDRGAEIYLSGNSGIYDKIVTFNSDLQYLETANGVRWFAPMG